MAIETEIERMVVRLMGDGSSYEKMLQSAVAAAAKFESEQKKLAAAEREVTKVMEQGAAVFRSVETGSEAYARQSKELKGLLDKGAISQETYNRAIARATSETPLAKAVQDAYTKSVARAAEITASVVNPTERYWSAQKELDSLLKSGRITQETYNRARERERDLLPSVVAAKQQAAKAEAELQRVMQRGIEVARNAERANERYASRHAEFSSLLSAGAISQETFNRSVANLKTDQLKNFGSELQSMGMQLTLIGGVATAAFGGIAAAALSYAGKFEQTTIAFEVMLGSASETQALLSGLTKFAAETQFEMPEVEAAARGLVTFGERGEELMTTLKNLGNAAAGTSTDFGMVATIYNQIRGAGKLLTQDFRQLSTRGILSLQDLADHFGVPLEAAQEMLSEGKITFNDVKEIFSDLSAEGGRFANLMERQSQTLLGRWSTLKDNVGIALRGIGESMMTFAKPAVEMLIYITDVLRGLPPWAKGAIGAFIGVGVAVGALVTAGGSLLLTVGSLTLAFGSMGGASAVLSAGLASLKAASMSLIVSMGPWVLGIAAVAAAYVALKSAIDAAGESARQAADKANAMGSSRADKIIGMPSGEGRDRSIENEISRRRGDIEAIKDEMRAISDAGVVIGGRLVSIDFQQYAALSKELNIAGEELEKFIQKTSELKTVTKDGKIVNADDLKKLDELIAKLKEDTAAFGKSGAERELFLLRSKNLPPELMKEAEALLDVAAAQERSAEVVKEFHEEKRKQFEDQKRMNESAKEFVNSLQAEIATFNMSSEAAKIYKMELDGVDASTIQNARDNLKLLDSMRAEKKLTEDLTKAADELKKKYASPVEKFEAEIARLQNLFDSKLIGKEIFDKAAKEAEKTFAEDMQLKVKVSAKWDASSADSAEAFSKLNDFRNMLSGQNRIALPKTKAQIAAEYQASVPDFWKVEKKPGEFDAKPKEPSTAKDQERDLTSIAVGIGELVALARTHWTGEAIEVETANLA